MAIKLNSELFECVFMEQIIVQHQSRCENLKKSLYFPSVYIRNKEMYLIFILFF
ncbi:Uncharacterized protein APZ42_032624 [Daphnia magna]|uniref:Uncharacterized protein n=1 Tax=Daphnia magna TaxID=35525 RepID=A0A164LQW9_9CRUS|nr:Uncharacterized protein APZ42_032624 [Daphnia magna]